MQAMAKGDPSQISVVLRDCTLYFSDDEDSEDWQKMLPTDQNKEIDDPHVHLSAPIGKARTALNTKRKEALCVETLQVTGGEGGGVFIVTKGHRALNGMEEKEGSDLQELHKVILVEADGIYRSSSSPIPCSSDGASKILPGKSVQCKTSGTIIEHPTMHRPFNCTPCNSSDEEKNSTQPQRNMSADRKLTLENLPRREKTYLCDNCGIPFTSSQQPTTPPNVHQPEELSSCPNCGSKCFQKQLAFEDQTADVVWSPHTCAECDMSFQNEADLLNHHTLHLDNPCWCAVCEKTFRSEQGLKIHRNLVHTGKKTLMCDHCGKCFKEHYNLLVHLKIHSKKKWRRRTPLLKLQPVCKDSHTCTVCHQSFGCASALLTHESFHSEERPFTCTDCGESFFQNSHLVNHQRKHTQHQCLYCEEVITQHGYCGRHQNLLAGKRPQCTLCGKTFSKTFSLRRHESEQHSGDKAHTCTECGKEFKHKYAFIMHQGIHLGDGPFKCTQCNTNFCLKSAFLEHMFEHTSEHLYTCVVCKKSFNNLAKLYEHQRLHTGEKPYTCNLCHKTFRRKDYVSVHLKKKHTGNGSLSEDRETIVRPSL